QAYSARKVCGSDDFSRTWPWRFGPACAHGPDESGHAIFPGEPRPSTLRRRALRTEQPGVSHRSKLKRTREGPLSAISWRKDHVFEEHLATRQSVFALCVGREPTRSYAVAIAETAYHSVRKIQTEERPRSDSFRRPHAPAGFSEYLVSRRASQ